MCKRPQVAASWRSSLLGASLQDGSHLKPLAATCSHLQPLAATCSHLQRPQAAARCRKWPQVAAHECMCKRPQVAASCRSSILGASLQDGSHLQPLQPLAAIRLAAGGRKMPQVVVSGRSWSVAAHESMCKRPQAAASCRLSILGASLQDGSHLQPLAATCSHLQPFERPQVAARCGKRSQVAATMKWRAGIASNLETIRNQNILRFSQDGGQTEEERFNLSTGEGEDSTGEGKTQTRRDSNGKGKTQTRRARLKRERKDSNEKAKTQRERERH